MCVCVYPYRNDRHDCRHVVFYVQRSDKEFRAIIFLRATQADGWKEKQNISISISEVK